MLRYVATAIAAIALLAIALMSRGPDADDTPLAVPDGPAPAVRVETAPTGRMVTVTHSLLGSVSRAALVYEIGGEEHTAAIETDCRKSLADRSPVADDGYATVVELRGVVPDGATRPRLVVESETGTRVYPLALP